METLTIISNHLKDGGGIILSISIVVLFVLYAIKKGLTSGANKSLHKH